MRIYNEKSIDSTLKQFYQGCSQKQSQLPIIIKDLFLQHKDDDGYQKVIDLWIRTFNEIAKIRYTYFEPLDTNCKGFYYFFFREKTLNIFKKMKSKIDTIRYKDLITHSECLVKAFIRETQNNYQNNKG